MKFHKKDFCIFTCEDLIVECNFKEKLEDILNRVIRSTFKRYIYWPYISHFSGFKNRVSRLIDFFPIVWNNYDFDYSSLLEFQKKQLERMIPVMENGHSVRSKETAKEIRTALILTTRLLENDYDSLASSEIEKRIGKTIHNIVKRDKLGVTVELSVEGKSPEYYDSTEKIRKQIYKKWENKRKSDQQYLFNLISRKLQTWWN